MCAGVFCLAVSDAYAKWLGEHYSTVQIVFSRMLIGLPLIITVGLAANGRRALKTAQPLAQIARGLLATGATFSFIFGLTVVPLAKATAIAFAAPVFVTALSMPVLRERVGPHRWFAVLIGFAGVLLIVRPGMAGFEPAVLILVAAALFYALLMMSARMMSRAENIWTMTFYMTLIPLLVSSAIVPWFWLTPQSEHLLGFLGVGVAGTSAMMLITQGFRLGPAAVVAPFDYTGLVWATLFGWLFWQEVPGRWAFVGAAAIVGGGAYLAYREARNGRHADDTANEPPRST